MCSNRRARGELSRWWPSALAVVLLAGTANAQPALRAPPNEVQVVAQWTLPVARPAKGYPFDLLSALDASRGCIPADVGGGKCNIYLYTDKPSETVARLAALERGGLLPIGLRIGVANYKNSAHTDWTYTPAYPADLNRFDQ